MLYWCSLDLDPKTGLLDGVGQTYGPSALKAKKTDDPDTPWIQEALSGPYADEFKRAMQKEIEELEEHKTWTLVSIVARLPKAPNWAWKIKRLPD